MLRSKKKNEIPLAKREKLIRKLKLKNLRWIALTSEAASQTISGKL